MKTNNFILQRRKPKLAIKLWTKNICTTMRKAQSQKRLLISTTMPKKNCEKASLHP
jgi:hypothetical protein